MYLAELSVASRNSAIKSYLRFCLAYGHAPCIEGVGISDHVLAAYAIFLALSGNHKSIQAYLSTGCKYICESYGGEWLTLSQRAATYRTVRALDRMYGTPPKRKHPITLAMLKTLALLMANTKDPVENCICLSLDSCENPHIQQKSLASMRSSTYLLIPK